MVSFTVKIKKFFDKFEKEKEKNKYKNSPVTNSHTNSKSNISSKEKYRLHSSVKNKKVYDMLKTKYHNSIHNFVHDYNINMYYINKYNLKIQHDFMTTNVYNHDFTNKYKDALYYYTGYGFKELKKYFYNNNNITNPVQLQDIIKYITNIKELFDNIPTTTKEFYVYRCINHIHPVKDAYGTTLSQLIHYNGFTSTTFRKSFAKLYCKNNVNYVPYDITQILINKNPEYTKLMQFNKDFHNKMKLEKKKYKDYKDLSTFKQVQTNSTMAIDIRKQLENKYKDVKDNNIIIKILIPIGSKVLPIYLPYISEDDSTEYEVLLQNNATYIPINKNDNNGKYDTYIYSTSDNSVSL